MKTSVLIATAATVVIVGGTAAGAALGEDGPGPRAARTATMDAHTPLDAPAAHQVRAVDGPDQADREEPPRTPHARDDDREDDRDEVRKNAPSAEEPRVTAARAERIALRARPGRVTEVERDTLRGRAVWEVEVAAHGTEYEVVVNGSTGRVVAQHQDDDHDDDRDDRDDRD